MSFSRLCMIMSVIVLCIWSASALSTDGSVAKSEACKLSDGIYNIILQTQVAQKSSLADSVFKSDSLLYYPVYLDSVQIKPGNINCKNKDYKIYLYSYNCKTRRPTNLFAEIFNKYKLSSCNISPKIISNGRMILETVPQQWRKYYQVASLQKKSLTDVKLENFDGYGAMITELKTLPELKTYFADRDSTNQSVYLGWVGGIPYRIVGRYGDLYGTLEILNYNSKTDKYLPIKSYKISIPDRKIKILS